MYTSCGSSLFNRKQDAQIFFTITFCSSEAYRWIIHQTFCVSSTFTEFQWLHIMSTDCFHIITDFLISPLFIQLFQMFFNCKLFLLGMPWTSTKKILFITHFGQDLEYKLFRIVIPMKNPTVAEVHVGASTTVCSCRSLQANVPFNQWCMHTNSRLWFCIHVLFLQIMLIYFFN